MQRCFSTFVTGADLIRQLWAPDSRGWHDLGPGEVDRKHFLCRLWDWVAMLRVRTMQCALVSFFLMSFYPYYWGVSLGIPYLESYILYGVNINYKSVQLLFCWPPTLVWTWHSGYVVFIYPQFARGLIFQDIVKCPLRSTLVRTLLSMKRVKHSPNILRVRPLCHFWLPNYCLNLDCTE